MGRRGMGERSDSDRDVRTGPLLTVSGTLLQNRDMLHFYRHIWDCIGLEMESTNCGCPATSSPRCRTLHVVPKLSHTPTYGAKSSHDFVGLSCGTASITIAKYSSHSSSRSLTVTFRSVFPTMYPIFLLIGTPISHFISAPRRAYPHKR